MSILLHQDSSSQGYFKLWSKLWICWGRIITPCRKSLKFVMTIKKILCSGETKNATEILNQQIKFTKPSKGERRRQSPKTEPETNPKGKPGFEGKVSKSTWGIQMPTCHGLLVRIWCQIGLFYLWESPVMESLEKNRTTQREQAAGLIFHNVQEMLTDKPMGQLGKNWDLHQKCTCQVVADFFLAVLG